VIRDVAIVGGGVSGLAAGFELKKLGYRVAVLERQHRVGGNAVSERFDGFLMEHGPSTVAAAKATAARFSRRLGLDGERCPLGDGIARRYLVGEGRLRGIPLHPLGLLVSDYLSLAGRARLLAEAVIPRRTEGGEETVAEFCTRRFGAELADRVVDPLVAGLYAGRASEISVSAVFPALVDFERRYGSVAVGAIRRRWRGGRMPGSRLYSWRDGIGTMPRALARALGDAVHTGIAVRRLNARPGGFVVDAGSAGTVRARAVLLAVQPHVAARLLEDVEAGAAEAAGAIAAPPLAVVYLGFRRRQVEHPLDGLGFLIPEGEGRDLSGAQFCSTMFPGRAPDGCVAIVGYVGGARNPDLARLPAADLIALTRAEFADLIGARGDPVVARVRHWPMGLPQYGVGHGERVRTLRSADQRVPGLFLTGNYFGGPSVADCLAGAVETAAAAHAYLAGPEAIIRQPAARVATG